MNNDSSLFTHDRRSNLSVDNAFVYGLFLRLNTIDAQYGDQGEQEDYVHMPAFLNRIE
jgi:hypothetical protein